MSDDEVRPVEGQIVDPLDAAAAQALTAEIRDAIRGVRAAAARLCAAVKRAHDARVWIALGYVSWQEYARQEFGIGRSHAYRLLDQAVTAEELTGAMVARGLVSPTGDTGALVAQLSGRDWRTVKGRADRVADLIAAQAGKAPTPLTETVLQGLVAHAVREVRRDHESAVAGPSSELEAVLGEMLAAASEGGEDSAERFERDIELFGAWNRARDRRIGELALRLAPEYVSDDDAVMRVMPLVEAASETPEYVLACRRYMQTGDERALPRDIEDAEEDGLVSITAE